MIYLIGGITKSGKSYLADKILKEKNIHVFRTDFLLFGFGGDDGLFKYTDSDSKVSKILEPNLLKIISFCKLFDCFGFANLSSSFNNKWFFIFTNKPFI